MDENNKQFKKEFIQKTASLLLAGFSFVAALAWNEAVKALLDQIFPLSQNTIIAKFVYAIIITATLVFISMRIDKLSKNQ